MTTVEMPATQFNGCAGGGLGRGASPGRRRACRQASWRALEMYRQIGDLAGEATVLNARGPDPSSASPVRGTIEVFSSR